MSESLLCLNYAMIVAFILLIIVVLICCNKNNKNDWDVVKYTWKYKKYPPIPIVEDDDHISLIERLFSYLFLTIRCFSLSNLKYKLSDKKTFIDIYLLFCFFALIALLLISHSYKMSLFSIIAIYFIIDTVNFNLANVFVDRNRKGWNTKSFNRLFLCIILNYLQIIIAYGILYLNTNSVGPISSKIDALYFSTVTITTLGYGDLKPLNQFGKILATSESIIGILMFVIIFGVFVSKMNEKEPCKDSVSGQKEE